MKKSVVILVLVFFTLTLFAQSPQKMSFQSLIRDNDENPIVEKVIGVKLSILKDYEDGAIEFSEIHKTTTNKNGLMTLEIGNGTAVKGALGEVNWSEGNFYFKIEIDPEGGTNYLLSSTTQVMSVPYALYAEDSDNSFYANYSDSADYAKKADALNDGGVKGQMLYWDGFNWVYLDPGIDGLILMMKNGVPVWGGGADSSYVQVFTGISKNITQDIAECEGRLKNDNELIITEKGICYGIYANAPTIAGNKIVNNQTSDFFACFITGLKPATIYYYRAYAITDKGVDYGDVRSFATLPNETVTDIDGNVYPVVNIGFQTWMAENLKTTKLNDGTAIALKINKQDWTTTNNPAYCYYNNDMAQYKNTYGALYNRIAVNTNKLCPTGWRVPSDDDFKTLSNFLFTNIGGKLKEVGTTNWNAPNAGATNELGFNALPGGERDASSNSFQDFESIKTYAMFWCSKSNIFGNTINSYRLSSSNNSFLSTSYGYDRSGYSVRCIKSE
ncbi:MAG: hypothetical protein JXB49_22145 [Bacteroidales bacterium]|nr:hypothetical protein [Bacteroidales bacterium]